MNILATIELYGGGPGSGCNPRAGKCGRKKKSTSTRRPLKIFTRQEVSKYIDTPSSRKQTDYAKMDFDRDYKVLEEDASIHNGIVLADGTAVLGPGGVNHDDILVTYAREHGLDDILTIVEGAEGWGDGSSSYTDETDDVVRWGWNKDMYVSVYIQIGKPTEKSLDRAEKLLDSLASDYFDFEWGHGGNLLEGGSKEIRRKLNSLRKRLR